MNKPTVDLSGSDGNAFAVLGRCRRAALAAGWVPGAFQEFERQAKSGDYDHLMQVVFEHFEVE